MTLEERVERLCRNRGITPPFRVAILQAFQDVRDEAIHDCIVEIDRLASGIGVPEAVNLIQFMVNSVTPIVDEG